VCSRAQLAVKAGAVKPSRSKALGDTVRWIHGFESCSQLAIWEMQAEAFPAVL
jgi:hypothetical protein